MCEQCEECNCSACTKLINDDELQSGEIIDKFFYNTLPTFKTKSIVFDGCSFNDPRYLLYYHSELECVEFNNCSFSGYLNYMIAYMIAKSSSSSLSVCFNNCNFKTITSLSNLFYNSTNLKELTFINSPIKIYESSNALQYTFGYCEKITELDLSNIDIINNMSVSYLFYSCKQLKKVDLQGWDFSTVTVFSYMFYNCIALIKLRIDKFNKDNNEQISIDESDNNRITILGKINSDKTRYSSKLNLRALIDADGNPSYDEDGFLNVEYLA